MLFIEIHLVLTNTKYAVYSTISQIVVNIGARGNGGAWQWNVVTQSNSELRAIVHVSGHAVMLLLLLLLTINNSSLHAAASPLHMCSDSSTSAFLWRHATWHRRLISLRRCLLFIPWSGHADTGHHYHRRPVSRSRATQWSSSSAAIRGVNRVTQ